MKDNRHDRPAPDIPPHFPQLETDLTPDEKQEAFERFTAAQHRRDKFHRYIGRPLKMFGVLAGITALIWGIWHLLSCLPANLEFTLPAMEYRESEPDSAIPTTISVKGKYYRKPFQDPCFVGLFDVASQIDSDWSGHNSFMIYFRIRDTDMMEGDLIYIVHEDSQWDSQIEGIAAINADLSLSRFALTVWEPIEGDGSNQTLRDLRICAPAFSREEAEALTDELIIRPKEAWASCFLNR